MKYRIFNTKRCFFKYKVVNVIIGFFPENIILLVTISKNGTKVNAILAEVARSSLK